MCNENIFTRASEFGHANKGVSADILGWVEEKFFTEKINDFIDDINISQNL